MTSMSRIVRGVLAHHAHQEAEAIRAVDHLHGTLGLTTLGVALAVLDIEDILDVRLRFEPRRRMETVGDLLALVHETVAQEHVAAAE